MTASNKSSKTIESAVEELKHQVNILVVNLTAIVVSNIHDTGQARLAENKLSELLKLITQIHTQSKAEERERIIKAIESGYREDKIGNEEGQYPPFAIMGFDDRPKYHRYIINKIKSLSNTNK